MKLTYADYIARADRLATRNIDAEGVILPSETDQAGADDTNINVIVKRYGVYGTVPSGMKTPQYGNDLSEIPPDLRDMIEAARMLEIYRGQLPEALRELNIDDLLSLTPETIHGILNPVAKEKTNEVPTT